MVEQGMNWGEQRYSTMTQINPENVGKLALAWSYELGPGGGSQQATPLYSNGVLYTVRTGASSPPSTRKPAKRSGAMTRGGSNDDAAGKIAPLLWCE
jgi:outer membrane protein assembly factor BamB